MSIHQKKKGYEKDDQNTICLPRNSPTINFEALVR